MSEMNQTEKIIELVHELQALSSAGLTYSNAKFDIERYERIREIAADITSLITDEPLETIKSIFTSNDSYQTPKISTRAAIFNEREEILLVKDYDDKWVMPGGWCDYNQTIVSNTMKEVLEEAGLIVDAYRLVGIFDHKKRNNPNSFFDCEHAFMLCKVVDGEFHENTETSESKYFPLNQLPVLNTHKTSIEQISICLHAYRAEIWEPIVD